MDKRLVQTPGSDEWWLARLGKKLAEQYCRVDRAEAWLAGRPPLPVPDNEKPGFERMQRIANVNLAELLVEARLHRMRLLGAVTKVDNSANGDDKVAEIFREQDLKRKFHDLFRYALGHHAGYAVIAGDGEIRVMDGKHAVVEKDASGRVVAGLTVYRDSVRERDVMILVREDYCRYAYRESAASMLPSQRFWFLSADSWVWGETVPVTLGRVPIYELTVPGDKSIIERHEPVLERINHGILQRMILIAMQAFRQRALKNVPTDEETGEAVDLDGLFESSPDALWSLPEGVEIWESGQADLTPVLQAVKHDLQYLAVASKTPLYMISPDDANGSAEGASAQRESLIFDIEALIDSFEGTLKRLLSDVLIMKGEPERADLSGFSLIWANPRRATIQEQAQSALTAKQAGLPTRFVLSKYFEFSPDEVEEAMSAMSEDAFLVAAQAAANG